MGRAALPAAPSDCCVLLPPASCRRLGKVPPTVRGSNTQWGHREGLQQGRLLRFPPHGRAARAL